MKVVFLDMDGVMNTFDTIIEIYNETKKNGKKSRVEIDEFRVKYLAEIIKKTNAKIVMSSSWRIFWNNNMQPENETAKQTDELFNKYNLKIYDKTPWLVDQNRGKEIETWLYNHNNIESFVILDDESFDLQKFKDKELIQTVDEIKNYSRGLNEDDIKRAIKILNKEEMND